MAWLQGFVPHVVSSGHPGHSCFLFWVPTPTVGRDKPQELARPQALWFYHVPGLLSIFKCCVCIVGTECPLCQSLELVGVTHLDHGKVDLEWLVDLLRGVVVGAGSQSACLFICRSVSCGPG